MIQHSLSRVRRRRCPTRRSGTAALEFVIVLPVLMVIVIGATDLSRALHAENVLSNAARVGAAYGATHQMTEYTAGEWETRIMERATEEAASLPNFNSNLLTVTVSTFDEPDGSLRVCVSVTYPFELVFSWPGWPSQVTLNREVSMRSYR